MEGVMERFSNYEYLHRSRQIGVWSPQIISNVVLQILQKLRPINTVRHELDVMVKFISHISLVEANWLSIVSSVMRIMPNDIYTMKAIVIIMRALPSPQLTTLSTLLHDRFRVTCARAVAADFVIRVEMNICIVLNCLAEKLAGNGSTQIFTYDVCGYLCHIFLNTKGHNDQELQMRALLALEKFSIMADNKMLIVNALSLQGKSYLSDLEIYLRHNAGQYAIRREFLFCVRWALDNIFLKPGRQLSFRTVNLSPINGILKNDSGNIFIKYSPDLAEIRNDTIWSQTLHGTCEVDKNIWFYEVTLVTNGAITVGWATTGADKNRPVGWDELSVGYDGRRRVLWHCGAAYSIPMGSWRPGDVIGCLLNITKRRVIFYMNGRETSVSSHDFFTDNKNSRTFFPAITMSAFQQCRVNLGREQFRCPPEAVYYSTPSTVGHLTPQQRMIYGMPRHAMQQQQATYNASEDACDICCDLVADVTLHPCGHRTLCFACSMKIVSCPVCRAIIKERR
ncbi:RING finger and SPRY domain-containing protein 1 [Papilio xuthus]|uniref:RING finger and SPRY domain-containing protein 1 n=1 Tax=Papilio xuthus TaxID=66420 RepID=A0A194PLE8_PAPXU|nr:RING finger and SPRY domain-containing protein 1 [Papilio xuthus]